MICESILIAFLVQCPLSSCTGLDFWITGELWCHEECIRSVFEQANSGRNVPWCVLTHVDDMINHFESEDNGGVRRIGMIAATGFL